MSELERASAVQGQASALTSDIRRTYGNRVSLFGLSNVPSFNPGGAISVRPPKYGVGLYRPDGSANK